MSLKKKIPERRLFLVFNHLFMLTPSSFAGSGEPQTERKLLNPRLASLICSILRIQGAADVSLFYRLAPMRLYSLSKRHFVLVFVVFLVCFALTVFIGVAGKTIVTMTQI